MLQFNPDRCEFVGPEGRLGIPPGDKASRKFLMLIEGQCLGLGGEAAARKYGFCKQRYYQILKGFQQDGVAALVNRKRGPKAPSRRTDEVVRQVLRHAYLDPKASVDVIAQKLVQAGWPISARSVRRVIEDYGLQKKTLRAGARGASAARRGASQ